MQTGHCVPLHAAPTYACVYTETPLHAILSRDGVAVLRVVLERHVNSNQRRPVSSKDLTPDDWCQAVWANKHTKKTE